MDEDTIDMLIAKLTEAKKNKTKLSLAFEDYDFVEHPISYVNIENDKIIFSE